VSTAPQAEYLTGKLIIAGDVDLDEGEIAPGVFIAIQREILRAVKVLPMYQQVAVVPVDDLAQLRAEIASVTAELQAAKDWILNDSKTIGELRSDLASLRVSYEQNAHQCVELNRDLARVTAQRDDCGTALSREIQKADSITYDLTALRASVAELESQRDAMEQDRDSWQLGCANHAINVRDLKRDIEAITAGRDYFKAISEGALKREDEHIVTIRELKQRNAELVAALRSAVKWLIMIDERRSDVPQWLRHDADPRPLRMKIEKLLKDARAESATPAKHPDTARLDWLEKNRPILWALSQYASGDYWAVTDQPGYTEESWAEYRTARAAIDAAIGKARHD